MMVKKEKVASVSSKMEKQRKQLKAMAPFRIKTHQSHRGRHRATSTVIEEIPLSAVEKQMIMNELGPLRRNQRNTIFWERLDEVRGLHHLTLDDVRTIIRGKLTEAIWGMLADNLKGRDWITQGGGDDDTKYENYKWVLKRALGAGTANWFRVTLIKQKPMEPVEEFAERKFHAYMEDGGVIDPDRDDEMFLELFADGFGPTLSKLLDTGITIGGTYREVLKWTMKAEARINKRKEREGTEQVENNIRVCYTYGRKGISQGNVRYQGKLKRIKQKNKYLKRYMRSIISKLQGHNTQMKHRHSL